MKFNKKTVLGAIALVVVTAVTTTAVLTNFGFVGILPMNEYRQYRKAIALHEKIEEDFYKKPNEKDMETGMLKGMFYGLGDVYSAYYTKDEMKQLMEASSGKYVGVGMIVTINKKTKAIEVADVFEGSPAQEAGVKKGDVILKVNGKAYTYQELDIAVKNMRGEPGTKATVTFSRDGKVFTKEITRREIVMESVKSKVIDGDIGYIQIKSFDEDTAKDFNRELSALEKKHIKGLIIDLRDDGGGLLKVVEKIADRILGEGVIVYTQDNKGNREYLRSTDREKLDMPIVVLTNGNTASASEILTGAILDHKAGISIGTRTFGKGLVQEVAEMRDGSGYKLTTAQYFTPNGDYINKKGIRPTIEVKDEAQQLPRAVQYLKEKIK